MSTVGLWCRAWLNILVLMTALGPVPCKAAQAQEAGASGSPLLNLLPSDVAGAFAVEDATALRRGEVGQAITLWMAEQEAMARTRRAWGMFAARLGVSETEAFDGLLGGRAVLAFGRRDARAPLDWIVLAAVEGAMDVRMVRRTRAVPRKIVHGRALLGLEEESFLLATLPPLDDGRSVLALAPAGAEWLLVRTLAVSAGKAEALSERVLGPAPAEAVVRGFWRPHHRAGVEGGPAGDLERWLWASSEPNHTLAVWATARGPTLEIGLGTATAPAGPAPGVIENADDVLLDITGPGEAIVTGVLDRAGLTGLVPEGLALTRKTGELVVRRGPDGVHVGARLPVMAPGDLSSWPAGQPVASLGQVRIRELSDTPASRAIFGPAAQMAWTLLEADDTTELVVAVTAGPGTTTTPAVDGEPHRAQAVNIVIEAVARPSPSSIGIHGSARPRDLWSLLRSTVRPVEPGGPSGQTGDEMGGFASVASLVARARWAVETAPGAVRGRFVLELREAARK